METTIYNFSHLEYGPRKYCGIGPNLNEKNVGLQFNWSSGICNDWNSIWNTRWSFISCFIFSCIFVYESRAFSCVILFSLRTGSDRISDYSGLYQKDPLITLGLSLCLLSLGGLPPMLGFSGKYICFLQVGLTINTFLVVVGLITSVISIYYYISVIKNDGSKRTTRSF